MSGSAPVPLVTGEDGLAPLPWLHEPLARVLGSHRGHALLVQGHPGAGVLPFVLSLAQGWLCEAAARATPLACGRCGSCRLVQARLHPDLQVLLPEALRRQHDWPLKGDKTDGDDAKRKPSRQIRIDEVREAIDAVQRTSARGRGKVVVLQPAEALNLQAANALLKTLEEPPEGTRLVLAAADASLLLPTLRSRCQAVSLSPPAAQAAAAWLAGQGVADPAVMLAAAGGLPLEVQTLAAAGIDAARWRALPAALAQGQAAPLQGLPLPRLIDILTKLCHDAMAHAAGAPGRFFPPESLPRPAAMAALADWSHELARVARHDEHPWNEPLMLDALAAAAARALRPAAGAAGSARFVTLQS
jgi:DNA polymerase-3 subunit delta'